MKTWAKWALGVGAVGVGGFAVYELFLKKGSTAASKPKTPAPQSTLGQVNGIVTGVASGLSSVSSIANTLGGLFGGGSNSPSTASQVSLPPTVSPSGAAYDGTQVPNSVVAPSDSSGGYFDGTSLF